MCLQNTPTSPSPPTPVSPPHASFSSSTHLCRQSVSSSPSFTAAVHSLGSGGRYTWGKKKQSTHLQACSRRFFFFFCTARQGQKMEHWYGRKKKWLGLFVFPPHDALVHHRCFDMLPFPRRLLQSQLGSCDPCVLLWSWLQPGFEMQLPLLSC